MSDDTKAEARNRVRVDTANGYFWAIEPWPSGDDQMTPVDRARAIAGAIAGHPDVAWVARPSGGLEVVVIPGHAVQAITVLP